MLVLSRKKDEKIIIKVPGRSDAYGTEVEYQIVLTVVKIDSQNRVRLGIEAADEVIILRSELEPTSITPK